MKKTITFIFLSVLSLSLSAAFGQTSQLVAANRTYKKQVSNKLHPGISVYSARIHAMLEKQQQGLYAAKHSAERTTTSTAERLIAMSDYDYNPADTAMYYLGIIDSSSFKYSGQRGSVFNSDFCNYLPPYGQYFNAGGLMNYYGIYNASTNSIYPSGILSDTALYWNSNLTDSTGRGVYMYAEKVYDVYNANNNVTFCSDQNFPLDSSGQWDQYINTYDANNNITSSLDLSWDAFGFTFDTSTLSFYFYNSSNQLVADSLISWNAPGSWNPSQKDFYSYTSGNLTNSTSWFDSSGVWIEEADYIITYNADNTIHTDSVSQNAGTGLIPSGVETFGYTPGADFWTDLQLIVYGPFGGGIIETDELTKHVAGSGLVDTFYISSNTPTGPPPVVEKIGFIYDSYNNPTTYYEFVQDNTTLAYPTSPSDIGHYYYEPYQSSASVKSVVASAENIQVYPNPATDVLTISRPDAVQGSATVITLTNSIGQTVRTMNTPWMNTTETFPLGGLTSGTYILTIQGQSGNVIYTQKVVKL